MIAEQSNTSYGNLGNAHNPVLLEILQNLEGSGLLSTNLIPGSPARITKPEDGGIQIYKNASGLPDSAVALEVISDTISRAILLGYQKGFEQGISPSIEKSDGATNIQFSTTIAEDLLLPKLSLNASTNVHAALIQIALELNAIKLGLQGLGVTLPNLLPTVYPASPLPVNLS